MVYIPLLLVIFSLLLWYILSVSWHPW